MQRKSFFYLSICACLIVQKLAADTVCDESWKKPRWKVDAKPKFESLATCGQSPRSMRGSMRHIEANGIGYNQGYTTFEGFFAPTYPTSNVWLPFWDVRTHIFNNGKPAVNAGFGVRNLDGNQILGIYSYYDYRKTARFHYNQVSLGFEIIGKVWDFRLNGYVPVGKKASPFSSHHEREFVMKGVNGEVGAHVDHFANALLYFAAGPYWLNGKDGNAWGGQVRGAVDLFEYVRLEANTSYDNVFKWIAQGQVGIVVPFGGRKTLKVHRDKSCQTLFTMSERALQRVGRFEILPVDKH